MIDWQLGSMLTCGLLIVVALGAQVVDEDRRERRKRRDLRRAAQLERARRLQAAADAEADAEYRRRVDVAARMIERHGWQWPDQERLP